MPLFEVDPTRPLLVRPGRRAAVPGVGTSAHHVVESHIDALLGEQVFAVASGTGPDEPHLLALDATGAPVVVELVGALDRAALTRALAHAGAAGRLTRAELAARYHGGPAAFQRDSAAFYDSVRVTRTQPGRPGARLIVICQDASREILNAVEFLRQPSMPVEVLKLDVVHASDGRRFVDVSPLVVHPAAAPAAPLDGGLSVPPASEPRPASDPAPIAKRFRRSVPRPDDVEPEEIAGNVAAGQSPTGKVPAVVRPPSAAVTPSDATPVPVEARDGGGADGPPVVRRRSRTDRFATPVVRQPEAVEDAAVAPAPVRAPWAPAGREPAPWEPSTREGSRVDPAFEAWEPSSADTPLRVPPLEAPRYTPPPPPSDEHTDPDLLALAQKLGRARPLVWSRPRRRQRFEATLQVDGTIELADGRRFRNADAAARAASGSATADGWGVWRLGAGGPSLLEAFREHFA